MATGMGERLHRSPRNTESFLMKRRAFRLVSPDGGLLVDIAKICSPKVDLSDVSNVLRRVLRDNMFELPPRSSLPQ